MTILLYVSESGLQAVTNYIKNQEIHHTKKSFESEVKEFEDKYGFILEKEDL